MNAVHILGRLTKDLDLRYTNSGKAVANGTLAVDRYSKGEKKADFIPFVIWDKSAENLANFTQKGSKIAINGSIQTRSYDNSEGKKVFVVEVLVDGFNGFELLDSKKDNQSVPTSNSQSQSDPFESNSTVIDISSDDLPF